MNGAQSAALADTTSRPGPSGNLRVYALEAKTELLKVLRLPAYALPTIGFPAMFYVLFALALGGRQQNGATRGHLHAGHLRRVRGDGRVAVRVRREPCHGAGAGLAAAQAGDARTGRRLDRREDGGEPDLQLRRRGGARGARRGIATRPHAARHWVPLVGVLVAGAVPFSAFGLALGYLCGPNSAPAVVNLIYLPMAFLSGLWVPIEMLPGFMKNLATWLPAYHFAQLALQAVGAGHGRTGVEPRAVSRRLHAACRSPSRCARTGATKARRLDDRGAPRG